MPGLEFNDYLNSLIIEVLGKANTRYNARKAFKYSCVDDKNETFVTIT